MSVEIESRRYELDPKSLSYIPAPPKPRWFDEELARLLPRTIVGEPFLQMVWGMDATTFRNGNPKDTKYIAAHEKITTRKFRRLDTVAGAFEYFDTRKEAADAVNIRLGDIQYKNSKEIRHWGPPRWILEGWLAPERFGTPKLWQRNRYADVKDLWGNTIKLDCNGPFPSRGQYRSIWRVEATDGGFRDLDRGVMTEIERLVHEHKEAVSTENAHSDRQQVANEVARLVAQSEAEEARIEEEFMEDHLGPSRYRLIEGNAFAGYGGSAAQQSRALRP